MPWYFNHKQALAARCSKGRPGRANSTGPRFMAGTAGEERAVMCADLGAVLKGRVPRRWAGVGLVAAMGGLLMLSVIA